MQRLLEQWGQEFAEAEITPVKGGIWRVELDGASFILKHRADRTQVWEEYDLMEWLTQNDQPVSELLCTVQEHPWAEHEGRIYVLYPYLEGISGDQLAMFDLDYAREIGAGLARLHRVLAAYESSRHFAGFDLFREVSAYAWPAVQSYLGVRLHNRLRDIEQEIGRNLVNPYEALPRQLIHRDFHPGNLVFQDRQLTGILDFDRVRLGIRLFDICYCATAVLSQGFTEPRARQKWHRFVQGLLQGYQTVQPLSKTEGYLFLYIIYLIQFLFAAYQLDAGSNELADLNIAMLLWINDQHGFLAPVIEKTIAG